MKKSYLMMAAAVAMLTACSQTDVLNEAQVQDEAQAIGFSTYSNKVTRAIADTDLEKYHETFGVWAYKTYEGTDTSIMANYQVNKPAVGDETWVYAGVGEQKLKYWDKRASYTFCAYAPYAAGVTIDKTSKVISIPEGEYAANENLQATFSETLNTNDFSGTGASRLTESTDWMVADVISRNVKENALVVENFRHTMSKLIVCFKTEDDFADAITLNSVSVNNVRGTGSYNSATGWAVAGAAKSISGLTGEIVKGKTYYSMEYLLIPSNDAPNFSVNYTINGDTYDVKSEAITGINRFDANTVYTLTVSISADPIEFDATVVDWQYNASGSATIQ